LFRSGLAVQKKIVMRNKSQNSPAPTETEQNPFTRQEALAKIDEHLAHHLGEHASNFDYATYKHTSWQMLKAYLEQDNEPEERAHAIFQHEETCALVAAIAVYFQYPGNEEIIALANKEVYLEN
jgi:hypothetical protein